MTQSSSPNPQLPVARTSAPPTERHPQPSFSSDFHLRSVSWALYPLHSVLEYPNLEFYVQVSQLDKLVRTRNVCFYVEWSRKIFYISFGILYKRWPEPNPKIGVSPSAKLAQFCLFIYFVNSVWKVDTFWTYIGTFRLTSGMNNLGLDTNRERVKAQLLIMSLLILICGWTYWFWNLLVYWLLFSFPDFQNTS